MVKLVDRSEFLALLDFQHLLPAGQNPMRVSSKAYILYLGTIKESFTLSEIKGDIEGMEISPSRVRDNLGIYEETELENLKRSFLEKSLLNQRRRRGAYTLTEEGEKLLDIYHDLIELDGKVSLFNFLQKKNQMYHLEMVGKLPMKTENLSQHQKEIISDDLETGKNLEKLSFSQNNNNRDSKWAKEHMTSSLKNEIKSERQRLTQLENQINKNIKKIEDKIDRLRSIGLKEEVEEVSNMLSKIQDNFEPRNLEI